MMDSDSQASEQSPAGQKKTVAGILSSALEMEDQISHGVYEEYLDAKNWPDQFDAAVLAQIRERLTVLIEDTRRHRDILEALSRQYDDKSG
jgi:hypothetical protein